MKITGILFLLGTILVTAQNSKYLTDKGFVAEGYDVVAYFDHEALKGKDAFIAEYDDVKFRFSSFENKKKFENNPTKYTPQYGGYCAYAMGKSGGKVSINPKSYKIQDGKLYLFYDSIFVDTLKKWNKEGPEELQKKADTYWSALEKEKE